MTDAGFDSDARCLDCNYPLRGLTVLRCPECGREFDPGDPWTMKTGRLPHSRLARRMIGPLPPFVRRTVLVSCAMIVWGSAWFPGAAGVEAIGWVILALTTCFSLTWRFARGCMRVRYCLGRPTAPNSEQYRWWQLAVVFIATTSPIFCLPLRITFLIRWPMLHSFVYDSYYVQPMLFPPPAPSMVAGFQIERVWIETTGVSIRVKDAGIIRWISPDTRYPLVRLEGFWLAPEWWVDDSFRRDRFRRFFR